MDVANLATQLNPTVILPEGVVIITLILVLLGDLIYGRDSARWTPYVAIAGLLASVAILYTQWNQPDSISFLGSFNGDNLSIIFRGIVALSTVVTILMSISYVEQSGSAIGEFMTILLAATVGGMFLCGSEELVMIFVSLETLSIASYLMTGYMKRDPRSNEAALKYLLIGASSSAIFLYGLSLLYGLSGGETHLGDIAAALPDSSGSLALAISLVFVIAGISFKIAAVPFHQWTPDVYEGAPTPVVAFLSVGSKAAGFALAIRLLTTAFPMLEEQWQLIFTALAILSMILGNVVAIAQTSMKRMLAYSSIGQAGFIMIGFIVGTEAGYASMLFYLMIYLFMNLGAFACVILFSLRTGTDQISDYAGLYQKDPFLTLAMSMCLLSLGGIPPLAGFFGKLYIFWAGWQAGAYGLVILALLTSVVSIYYYIRVVKMMVVKEPQEMSLVIQNYPATNWQPLGMRPLQVGVMVTLVLTMIAGVLSNPLFTLVNTSVASVPVFNQISQVRPADAVAMQIPVSAPDLEQL
ncbi:MAG: NAD(P)H-quinone oxidoreductase subunit N [Thermosynechococcaceae cyanobacterium]